LGEVLAAVVVGEADIEVGAVDRAEWTWGRPTGGTR